MVSSDALIDDAFGSAREAGAAQSFPSSWSSLRKRRADAKTRISVCARIVRDELRGVESSVPNLGNLSEFHEELLRVDVDIDAARQALGRLKRVREQVDSLAESARDSIVSASYGEIGDIVSSYFGRVASLVESVDDVFDVIPDVKEAVGSLPSLTDSVVVLAGFPNGGKSSVFTAVTGREVRRDTYAFTTTGVSAGTFEGVTLLDTPPVLHRNENRNALEEKAYVSCRYGASRYVFCWSPDYDDSRQAAFVKSVVGRRSSWVVYAGRCDAPMSLVEELLGFEGVVSDVAGVRRFVRG